MTGLHSLVAELESQVAEPESRVAELESQVAEIDSQVAALHPPIAAACRRLLTSFPTCSLKSLVKKWYLYASIQK